MKVIHSLRAAGLSLCCLAAACLAIPAQAADRNQEVAKQLAAACAVTAKVDRSKLPAPTATRTPWFQAEARTGRMRPDEAADPLITAEVRTSGPSRNPILTYWAWRDEAGWIVSRATYLEREGPGLPWPHEPGLEKQRPPSNWTVTDGRLSADEGRRLDTLLASKCLRDEPPVRPLNLPLKGGDQLPCYWHPTSTELHVRVNATERRFSHSCNRFDSDPWASDLIIDLLAQARLQPIVGATFEPVDASQIPPAFRGRWSVDPDRCEQWLELAKTEAAYRGVRTPVASVRLLGSRTIVVQADWSVSNRKDVYVPFRDEQLLLLSPEGNRLALDMGFAYVLRRCP